MAKMRWCALGVLLLGIIVPMSAQSASVAYINASGDNINYLTAYGHTVTNITPSVPLTLSDLTSYDVVVAASNSVFLYPKNVADVLGDFADSGRGVVLTEFVFQSQWALNGKIMSPGYSPFTVDPGFDYGIISGLGTVFDPASPLFEGVTLAGVHTQYQANSTVQGGAVLVANWDSGRPAIAYSNLADSRVVGLNLFPAAGTTQDNDTRRLLANAVSFSQDSSSPVPVPSSVLLLGTGLIGLAGFCRKRSKS